MVEYTEELLFVQPMQPCTKLEEHGKGMNYDNKD